MERVHNLYEDNEISRRAVARGTGLSRTYVSRIFSGQRNPSIDTCARLAAYLGVTIDEFYLQLKKTREAAGNGKKKIKAIDHPMATRKPLRSRPKETGKPLKPTRRSVPVPPPINPIATESAKSAALPS